MKKSLIFALFSIICNNSIFSNNPNNKQSQLTETERRNLERNIEENRQLLLAENLERIRAAVQQQIEEQQRLIENLERDRQQG